MPVPRCLGYEQCQLAVVPVCQGERRPPLPLAMRGGAARDSWDHGGQQNEGGSYSDSNLCEEGIIKTVQEMGAKWAIEATKGLWSPEIYRELASNSMELLIKRWNDQRELTVSNVSFWVKLNFNTCTESWSQGRNLWTGWAIIHKLLQSHHHTVGCLMLEDR